ncbi:MAG: hypothetical protein NTX59_05340 [Elusimicrobia bacterium]|nr:hypothetical protein [Elusimicrobiota bacterium]
MKTKTVLVVLALVLAAAGFMGHMRAERKYRAADLVAGYRGFVMELPKAQLSWVKKGAYLDVISVFEAQMKDNRKEKISATILQNVKVAGVDHRKGTVVLLLNPLEAEYAALAPLQGNISIALRAPGDSKLAQLEIGSYSKLIK